jgi:Fe2+ transport system protein FeoA
MRKLSELKRGETAQVVGISSSELKPKLLEMGLVNGQHVKLLFKAPFGDPVAVEVGDYVLSMRKDEAVLVEVE